MNRHTGTTVTAQGLIATRAAIVRQWMQVPPTSALPGGHAVRKRGQGTVIADSRVYMSGDDMRYVDRGATARTGQLHVRTFHEERDQVSFLVADFRPSMLWGMQRAFRSVAAAEALAWLGWKAVERGGRVGLMAITSGDPVIVKTRGGTRGMLAVIGGLVKAHERAIDDAQAQAARGRTLQPDPPLDAAFSGLHRIVPRGASIILASALDQIGDQFQQVLGNLTRHRTPRFIVVEDGALTDLPTGYYPTSERGGRRRSALYSGQRQSKQLPTVVADYDAVRIDAGQAPHDAMAGVSG